MKAENTIYEKVTFDQKMKMADLIDYNPSLLTVVDRFGLPLGFADASVEEICRGAEVTPEFFLLICTVYTFRDFTPDAESLSGIDAREIVGYLQTSHDYYRKQQVPRLKDKLRAMTEVYGREQKAVIARFFDNYQVELENHFLYEDQTVFPYVREVAQGTAKQGYSIEQFEENHSNIEETLNDLKNIILKYLPAADNAELRIEVLLDIYLLEEDLKRHTSIENRILIPYVAKIEKDGCR